MPAQSAMPGGGGHAASHRMKRALEARSRVCGTRRLEVASVERVRIEEDLLRAVNPANGGRKACEGDRPQAPDEVEECVEFLPVALDPSSISVWAELESPQTGIKLVRIAARKLWSQKLVFKIQFKKSKKKAQ